MNLKDAMALVRQNPNVLAGSPRGIFGLKPTELKTLVLRVEGKFPEEIAAQEGLRRMASVDARVQVAGVKLKLQQEIKDPSKRRAVLREQGILP